MAIITTKSSNSLDSCLFLNGLSLFTDEFILVDLYLLIYSYEVFKFLFKLLDIWETLSIDFLELSDSPSEYMLEVLRDCLSYYLEFLPDLRTRVLLSSFVLFNTNFPYYIH